MGPREVVQVCSCGKSKVASPCRPSTLSQFVCIKSGHVYQMGHVLDKVMGTGRRRGACPMRTRCAAMPAAEQDWGRMHEHAQQ